MANPISSENDDLERVITKTDLRCGGCNDPLYLVEEVFEVRIIQAQLSGGQVTYLDVLSANGGFAYPPHYLEFSCWEELEEELEELIEDVPPVEDALPLLECDFCRSHIRELETVGLVRYGELHCAPQVPNGDVCCKFENLGRDKHVCIACLQHINDEHELWPDDLAGIPGIEVCRDGLFERCWRYGKCSCREEEER